MKSPSFTLLFFVVVQFILLSFNSDTERAILSGSEVKAQPQTSVFASPPNVLFIIVDDLNDYTGYLGGHPDASTPNIDRLAEYLINAKTDHLSPVRIKEKGTSLWFKPIRPTFRRQPITVKAQIGPKVTDGVLLQHGGQACGYALYIKDGYLSMSIMDVPEPLHWKTMKTTRTIIRSKEPLAKVAQNVEGRLSPNGLLTLHVNGKEVGRQMARTLSLHPSGQMVMGAAAPAYLPVGDYDAPFRYTGDVDEVVVTFGGQSR